MKQKIISTEFTLHPVTEINLDELGVYCIRNDKSEGVNLKKEWYRKGYAQGLRMVIAKDKNNKQAGFIEYTQAENAWRPINAPGYLFIHCIVLFSKEVRNQNLGSLLLEYCEQDAVRQNKNGVCAFTSQGVWMAGSELFVKNGFEISDTHDRFELVYKKLVKGSDTPAFIDWEKQLKRFKGWNLVYSNQCPWHDKSAKDLKDYALQNGIELKVTRLNTPEEAHKNASGFGTFALIKDGVLLADHYISQTRFKNIIQKQS